MKKGSDKEFTVANLGIKKGILQTRLDIRFAPSDRVHFRLSGAKIPVNLVGTRVSEETETVDDCEASKPESTLKSNPLFGGKRKASSADGAPVKKAKQDKHSLKTINETLPKKDDIDEINCPFVDSNIADQSKELKKLPVESDEETEDEYEYEDEEEDEEYSDEETECEDQTTLTESSMDYDSEENKRRPRYPDVENYSVELKSPGKWLRCTSW